MQDSIISHYKHACLLDMQAIKPGNVGFHSDIGGLTTDDFLRSADVSALPVSEPSSLLGKRIFNAIEATHNAVKTNTNLGIILLVSPIIQGRFEKEESENLRSSISQVLKNSTINDAKETYRAIKLAKPGGMGKKDYQDLSQEPSVTLLKTMKIAENWDRIAAQYSNNFQDIFEFGVPCFNKLLAKWQNEKWATTGLFLSYLANYPDSLIERKYSLLKAKEISDMISPLEREVCRSDSPGRYESQLLEVDGQLKQNRINPGTTADLAVATIFAAAVMQMP